jgi:hypothetical protein
MIGKIECPAAARQRLDIRFFLYTSPMIIEFTGTIFQWRGPSPFYYVAVPEEQSLDIKDISDLVTYGWGVIPVQVRIGNTDWKTSLFPKDGRYLVPLKDAVRKAEKLDDGDLVAVRLELRL